MSDPAIVAAEVAAMRFDTAGQVSLQAVAAAREALKPLQELHTRTHANGVGYVCSDDGQRWPCRTAKFVYPSEDVEQ